MKTLTSPTVVEFQNRKFVVVSINAMLFTATLMALDGSNDVVVTPEDFGDIRILEDARTLSA